MVKAKGTILLAAGGTGGHLFPAEALGVALAEHGFDVHLLTDRRTRHLVSSFVDDHVHIIRSATFKGKNPLKFVKSLFFLMFGLFQSLRLVGKFKPCLVAGFGGYPALPPLYAATVMGVCTFIHEQNAVMGRANRFLASRVNVIAGGFLDARGKYAGKIIVTGNPLRKDVIEASRIPYQLSSGNMPFSLLVFGGSQGATFFSDILPQALMLVDKSVRSRLVIIQQARACDVASLRRVYRDLDVKADIKTFFRNMPDHIARAHYIIARSGASTVAEIAAIGRPALMVPYPDAIDHDQMRNAEALALSGGIKMMLQKELTSHRLAAIICEAMNEPETLAAMAAATRLAGHPDATGKLVDMVQALVAGKLVDEIKKETSNENAS